MALDRITNIIEIQDVYIEDFTDWDYFFSEIIGVSKPYQTDEVEVQLLFSAKQSPYIKTKPIHETQKHYEAAGDGLLVKIKVIPNFELEQLILSFGDGVTVISPEHLKLKILERLNKSLSRYS